MKIAIVGYGREGKINYSYWNHDGNELTICDQRPQLEVPADAQTRLGKDHLKGLDTFDLIVRTAGVHPGKISAANPEAPDILKKVTSSSDEFMRASPSRNIIGVTGTKGKGTTSVLIVEMLKAAGYRTHLAGNIGIPPLELLQEDIQPDDWVVLELSSFQLMDLKSSPHIGVCVMMTEEHLNWHTDFAEYITSKQQLFRWQKPDDIAVYYGHNVLSQQVASVSQGKHVPYMEAPGAYVANDKEIRIGDQSLCKVSEIQLLGKHNWQNICAAATVVWQVTHDAASIGRAIKEMKSLPHRLEPVREVGGVQYYNDSFASAPGSAVAALDAITGTKVMIIGGLDKGLNMTELAEAIAAHTDALRKVLIIGAIAPRMAKSLEDHGFTNYEVLKDVDMRQIVARAHDVAEVGDSVVLSPGSSSFDMFIDFVDRGDQFKEAVNAL